MHVLVCEHEGHVARLIELTSTRLGHSVTSVGTWAGALDELRRTVPYLLVIDTSLPDVSTQEAIATVRSDERTSEVLVLLIGRTRGNYNGPEHFLQKPFNPRTMFDHFG